MIVRRLGSCIALRFTKTSTYSLHIYLQTARRPHIVVARSRHHHTHNVHYVILVIHVDTNIRKSIAIDPYCLILNPSLPLSKPTPVVMPNPLNVAPPNPPRQLAVARSLAKCLGYRCLGSRLTGRSLRTLHALFWEALWPLGVVYWVLLVESYPLIYACKQSYFILLSKIPCYHLLMNVQT